MTTSDSSQIPENSVTHNRRATDVPFSKEDVATIAKELKGLRGDIQVERKKRRNGFLITGVAFLLMFALVFYGFTINARLASVANSNQKILASIQSCVNPAGQCYKNGQEQQSKAVTLIGVLMVAAVDCANQHPNDIVSAKVCVSERTGYTIP